MTAETIQRIPLLSNIETDVLEKHLANRQISFQRFFKGATVYNQNDLCHTLDVVLSGGIVAYSLSENGSASSMFKFQKNSIIGANLLFGENHTYPLNIYCLHDSKLLHITKDAVSEYLHDYNFVMHYVRSMSKNSQNMNQKITMITQNTLRFNLLSYLQQQSKMQNSSTVLLPISKRELADYLGVQRPSLFREFKKLKDEGIIDVQNRSIKLTQNNG